MLTKPIIFTIPFKPVTKKNSQVMVPRRSKAGRIYAIPIPSKQYKAYEDAAGWVLNRYATQIDYPVNIKAIFYMPTLLKKVDLTNLLEALDDVLVKYEVLADDNRTIVVSHDGSRVYYDKHNPRTEVTITEMPESEVF